MTTENDVATPATEDITAGPRFWLRRCNGADPGDLVDAAAAAFCAEQPGASGSLDSELRWTARGTQHPLAVDREFTLTPLTDDQARAWIRLHRRGPS